MKKETNVIKETDHEPQTCGNMKVEDSMILNREHNTNYQIPISVQELSTMEQKPIDFNMDSIHGSEKVSDLLEESCELLSNLTSDFISNSVKPLSNVVKMEELQNSHAIDNVKTFGLTKTDESYLNILKEQNYIEESVKEEEDILTSMTTQFINENMNLDVKYENKKPKPSKIEIIKPKPQPLVEINEQDLQQKIKAIEFSLKGKDLVEFRKIVKHNSQTNNFKHILNKFRLKLKYKITKSPKIL